MGSASPAAPDAPGKIGVLLRLALAQLLVMTLWFSASAAVPQLSAEWDLGAAGKSWLTMSVQLGFVAGALVSALANLSDRIAPARIVAVSALGGALANAAIPELDGPLAAIGMRFVTGFFLAGVYPPGMKLVASWTRADRGLWIGVLVAAITFGSALPHLLNALPLGEHGGMPPWETMLHGSSALALVGALVVATSVRSGPLLGHSAPFAWRSALDPFKVPALRYANFGYLGHMWELYAMWTWVPLLLIACYDDHGWSLTGARVAGFGTIAIGALGCVVAGLFADRIGRTLAAGASLVASGSCAILVGFLADSPGWLTVVCLIWGFAVVADSAQFSAAISELGDPRYVGTALTVQTSLGFLLTMISIHLVPPLVDSLGWGKVFWILVPGPLFGVWSMVRLRQLPDAVRMASGNR